MSPILFNHFLDPIEHGIVTIPYRLTHIGRRGQGGSIKFSNFLIEFWAVSYKPEIGYWAVDSDPVGL